MYNFINNLIAGDALLREVDDYIHSWHESDSKVSLHEYLGMTRSEYALFVENNDYLSFIVKAHKNNLKIEKILEEEYLSLAARAENSTKANKILTWLKDNGLWERD